MFNKLITLQHETQSTTSTKEDSETSTDLCSKGEHARKDDQLQVTNMGFYFITRIIDIQQHKLHGICPYHHYIL